MFKKLSSPPDANTSLSPSPHDRYPSWPDASARRNKTVIKLPDGANWAGRGIRAKTHVVGDKTLYGPYIKTNTASSLQAPQKRRIKTYSHSARGEHGGTKPPLINPALLAQADRAAPSVLEAATQNVDFATIPKLLPTALSGFLYDEEGPRDEAEAQYSATDFFDKKTGGLYVISSSDARVASNSKRRRWAIDPAGNLRCCMEFIGPTEKPNMRLDVLTNKDIRASFLQKVQGELQRAHVCNPDMIVYELVETEEGCLLAMVTDFPEESSYLLDHVSDATFVPTAYKFFSDVVNKLVELQKKRIVHGDIKLENIMMTQGGDFTLIDFESAASLNAEDLAPITATTHRPPEFRLDPTAQVSGYMGTAGDNWGLGVCLVDAFALRDRSLDSTWVKEQLQQLSEFDFQRARRAFLDAEKDVAPEQVNNRFGPLLSNFWRTAPRLYTFCLKYLLTDDAALRSSLAPAQALADALMRMPSLNHTAAQQSRFDVLSRSMSRWIAPGLVQYVIDKHQDVHVES